MTLLARLLAEKAPILIDLDADRAVREEFGEYELSPSLPMGPGVYVVQGSPKGRPTYFRPEKGRFLVMVQNEKRGLGVAMPEPQGGSWAIENHEEFDGSQWARVASLPRELELDEPKE